MNQVTERQAAVLDFITTYAEKHQYTPSLSEIAKHFKVTIKAVSDHIFALEQKGYLKRDTRKPIVILKKLPTFCCEKCGHKMQGYIFKEAINE